MVCRTCRRDLDPSAFSPCFRRGYPSRRTCRKCCNERMKAYQAAHRDKVREYNKRYERAHVEQRNAKSAVKHALRSGALESRPCAVCGADAAEAHHFSYAPRHWLSVYWLCSVHHGAVHTGELSLAGLPPTIGTVARSREMIADMLAHLGDPLMAHWPTEGRSPNSKSLAVRIGRALANGRPAAS